MVMVLQGFNKRLPSSLRAAAVWVLAVVVLAAPTTVHSAKETFDRSKPHVNIGARTVGGGTGSGMGSLLTDGGWYTGDPAVGWSFVVAADGTLVSEPDPVTLRRVYNKRKFSEEVLQERTGELVLTIKSAGPGDCMEAYSLTGCVPTSNRIIVDNVGDQGALEELTIKCTAIDLLDGCPS